MEQIVRKAGELLQDITDFVRENGPLKEKVRFPRKYISPAGPIQSRLAFVSEKNLRKSISYNFILMDVFRWLLSVTDIDHTAKRMLIKNCIVVYSSICESMITAVISSNKKFKEKTKRMAAKGMIDEDLRCRLNWLWDKREGIHIYLISQPEDELYKLSDYIKAKSTTYDLLDAIEKSE